MPFLLSGGKDTAMKITYRFVDGETSESEVSEDIGEFILESRREEDNLARKERYHCYSYDAAEYESEEYADEHTPEDDAVADESKAELGRALNSLSAGQRRRLLMFADGMSIREIARREHVDYRAVWKSIESAKITLKNFRE